MVVLLSMGTGELVDAASLEWEAELRDLLLQKRFCAIPLDSLNDISARQRPTRILDPRNSRENQLHFFSLDHEISFCNSRSLLETWDFERKNLVLVSNPEIYKTKIPFSLETRDLEKNILDLVSNHEIQRDKNLDLVSKNPYISLYSFDNNSETGSNVLTYSIHSRT